MKKRQNKNSKLNIAFADERVTGQALLIASYVKVMHQQGVPLLTVCEKATHQLETLKAFASSIDISPQFAVQAFMSALRVVQMDLITPLE